MVTIIHTEIHTIVLSFAVLEFIDTLGLSLITFFYPINILTARMYKIFALW